jgi:hypothetical protein
MIVYERCKRGQKQTKKIECQRWKPTRKPRMGEKRRDE